MNGYADAKVMKIRDEYLVKERTKFDDLKALDKKVKTPAQVFGYTFGSVGALVLGTGMCFAMKVIGNAMAAGIVIGVVGIAMVSATYSIYKAILRKRKNKYGKEVLALTDDLLNK